MLTPLLFLAPMTLSDLVSGRNSWQRYSSGGYRLALKNLPMKALTSFEKAASWHRRTQRVLTVLFTYVFATVVIINITTNVNVSFLIHSVSYCLAVKQGPSQEWLRSCPLVKRCVLEAIRLRAPGMIPRKVTQTHTIKASITFMRTVSNPFLLKVER